jgi:Recombination endonuclease VII
MYTERMEENRTDTLNVQATEREKRLAEKRAKYWANHDENLAKARIRREKNKERRREQRPEYDSGKYKQYYKEHRDRIRELRKLSDARHKEDIRDRNQAYYEANRDKLVQRERDKRAQDPMVLLARERREMFRGKPWLRQIWWRFRPMISWEKFKEIAPQVEAGPCDVCGKTGERMRFDHDHVTLKFRGLLCHKCNVGLGHYADDPVMVRKAAEYLEKAKLK